MVFSGFFQPLYQWLDLLEANATDTADVYTKGKAVFDKVLLHTQSSKLTKLIGREKNTDSEP